MSQDNMSNFGKGKNVDVKSPIAPPQLSLPRGGGAIRGIGEKFAANPVDGTGSLSIPIYASPGRDGFGPQLSLSYGSGSGNGSFGFGWNLALPAITRKTDKGLPQYNDAQESDTFILAGAEDLVPLLTYDGSQWQRDVLPRTVSGQQYTVHRYRPRVEGLFARIERWLNTANPQDTFWRSISKDNTTIWYGKTPESRIADPLDASRVFSWLICESYDDRGNAVVYSYKAEDSAGVDKTAANERNRSDQSRSSQRYIKYIYYGNRDPYFPDPSAVSAVAQPVDWCFQLVFDYGEHDLANPTPQDAGAWNCRADSFSSYRSTFEVRTYRLCRRVLMFHHFANVANVRLNCLVRSTDLSHSSSPAPDPTQPFYSFLISAAETGYVRTTPAGYISKSLPPAEFEYTEAIIDETVREVDDDSLQNLPYGIDNQNYRWADLDGEGLSGILSEEGGSWFYKANLSPANQQNLDGETTTLPRFAAVEAVTRRPSLSALAEGRQQLMDLSGDGKLDLVDFEGATPGFYERTDHEDWKMFRAFDSFPVLDWRNPNLKFIDLTGDGFPDLLISEDDAFWWHTSLSTEGFGPAQRVQQSLDEEKGPQLVFADGTESVFLADMSGDGLTDLVRLRNGEVCYWPNLGYGRFGAKVTMDQSPLFERGELFDGHRLRLADIDGSGTADILYVANGEVHLYFNQSGNAWGARRALEHFPSLDSVSSATAVDLLGNGTACLVWCSPLPGSTRRPMRYIDLMGGQKPHLLTHVTNNLGSETVVQYAPSTKFYVEDKLAGTPWLTRIPFPVHVVERVEIYDSISRNRFVTRYAYHHGYYDGVEREFRGFGRVDHWDTEEIGTLTESGTFPPAENESPTSNVPPVLTKTWFHTGAFFGENVVSKQLEHEYYSEDASDGIAGLTQSQLEAMLLDDTVLPVDALRPDGTRVSVDLSGEEMREACRALRGSILREEIYGLDGSDESDRPYTVSERNYTIEVLQPEGPNPFGVFFAHAHETLDFQYERKLYKVVGSALAPDQTNPPGVATNAADPRVTHAITLAVDGYGNLLQSAAIAYGRRYSDPAITTSDQFLQAQLLCTCVQNDFTNAILDDDAYRTPQPAGSKSYELLQFAPDANQPGVTNLFRFAELQTKIAAAGDGSHDISFENLNPTLTAGQPYQRLLSNTRIYYRPDDCGQAAGDAKALLPWKTVQPLALVGSSCKLAFTQGLIPQVYQRGGSQLITTPATIFGSTGADGCAYTDLDGDGNWWVPSGRSYFALAPATPAQEKSQAVANFYLPRRFEDPFGNVTSINYDPPHNLMVTQTTDAALNTSAAVNDYRVLAPSLINDPNGNRAAASFDALGMPVGTALMGKEAENLGDSLTGFVSDLAQADIDNFWDATDPHTVAGNLLGNATTRTIYDVQRFLTSKMAAPDDPSKWSPVFAAILARETHVSDLAQGQSTKIQIQFGYSDGFGREIQKKVQAEPGPLMDLNPRWVANGWTIFNNKGKPVRQYEPFFSQLAKGHQFEFGVLAGVSPILCYDPVERVAATLRPDHSYDKVVFDPWRTQTWDGNDTVLQANPAADSDVGDYLQLLQTSDLSPTWYALRTDPAFTSQAEQRWPDPTLRAEETEAANKAALHANTPTLAYFDPLGRTFLTIADNGSAGTFATRVALDIQGNQRTVTDALGRKVMAYDYDVLGNRIHQSSMEAGERWMLTDAMGKAVRSWNTRGHNFRNTYDALRRPTAQYVQGTDSTNSDLRTLAAEVLFQRIDYGEGQANDLALNLRTRVYQTRDAAGLVTSGGHNSVTNQDEAYDFKGNLLRGSRQFVADYKPLPDWSSSPALQPDFFTNSTQYDALNRPISSAIADGSVIRPTYNEANFLETLTVNLQGAATPTSFITNIDYDAKGQRTLIAYGNSTQTVYSYDPETFRLVRLTTSRGGFPAGQQTVQDLAYTFDPVGNITHIQDDADLQNVIFFRNQRIEPSNDYTYDAIYRLIQATGREQLGLGANGNALAPTASSYNDVPRVLLFPSPTDGNAMGTYIETYQYDAVGNFLQLVHSGSQPENAGWTRTYTYDQPSLLEQAKVNNRLGSTSVSGSRPLTEIYSHDVQGNMTAMPQLQVMQWDFKDQLFMTQRLAVNAGDSDGTVHQRERTYYVYDAVGQRARKVTESSVGIKKKERFYLGGFEVYREYDSSGTVTLERQSVHVMDDKQRIALVETRTVGTDGAPEQLIRYQFGNHLGSASLELDDQAQVISYEEYCPYGNTSYQAGRSQTDVALKRYRYTGMERDEESGLSYHGARYYTTWLGRWGSCDPTGLADGTNLYAYARCNPIRLFDTGGSDSKDAVKKFKKSKEWRAYVKAAQDLKAANERLEAFKRTKEYASLQLLDEADAKLADARKGIAQARKQISEIKEGLAEFNQKMDWWKKDDAAREKWNDEHNIFDKLVTSYDEEKEYRAEKEEHRDWEVRSNILLEMTGSIQTATPGAAGNMFVLYAGALGTAPKTAPGEGLPASGSVSPGPGSFTAADVALGLTKQGLPEFAGEAKLGTSLRLASRDPQFETLAEGCVREAAETVAQTGGRIRFSLKGFDINKALDPTSPLFKGATSGEFRAIMRDPALQKMTTFYDVAGNSATGEQVFGMLTSEHKAVVMNPRYIGPGAGGL